MELQNVYKINSNKHIFEPFVISNNEKKGIIVLNNVIYEHKQLGHSKTT